MIMHLVSIRNVKLSYMKDQQQNIETMRARLSNYMGSQEPFCIRKKNDEMLISFIRGFADTDHNIVCISEKSHSLSMNIIEIKNIQEIKPWTHTAA